MPTPEPTLDEVLDAAWKKVVAAESAPDPAETAAKAADNAVTVERARCAKVIDGYLAAGVKRGLPDTSAVMVILAAAKSAVENPPE